ncbi:DUF2290 domain-containing protein [Paracoccus sp. 228]|uniref:DUF2290 domain-containing protein n=1 Tax=Paracoccus sp. 228 TaxID=1192054 RepID=UPI000A03446B|nr:DUF2290 domain-containing protein [Paracoccus sp. 228]
MKRADFDGSIRNAGAALAAIDLLAEFSCQVSLPRSEDFNKVCLTSKSYSQIYEKGLSLSHYNIRLKDLAYFQFSHQDDEEFALAFYPNPRVTGSLGALSEYLELEEMRDNNEIDEEEFHAYAEAMPVEHFVPRVRFEYSKSQFKRVIHPGAHFHIGMSGEDRWSSARKISPLSFVYLMLKYYYPNSWRSKSRFYGAEDMWKDAVTIAGCWDEVLARSLINDGASHYFNDDEKRNFHFSSNY